MGAPREEISHGLEGSSLSSLADEMIPRPRVLEGQPRVGGAAIGLMYMGPREVGRDQILTKVKNLYCL